MRKCTECKVEKDIGCFSTNRNRKDGIHNQCRECTNRRRKEWGKTHPRPYSTRKKEYYSGNQTHIKARSKVNHMVEGGKLPRVSTLLCMDCGIQAQQYDHYKGYEPENWLDIQPVCSKCSDKRDIVRGNRRRYA